MEKVEQLGDNLAALNVAELQHLKKYLKDKYGLEETVSTVAAPVIEAEEVIEEQTEFNVTLVKVSALSTEKMNTIRLLKEITSTDLKEAKALCDGVPSLILEKTNKTTAEDIKTKLEALNAEILIS